MPLGLTKSYRIALGTGSGSDPSVDAFTSAPANEAASAAVGSAPGKAVHTVSTHAAGRPDATATARLATDRTSMTLV